ncbi:MAG: hypothetical protein KatS3mg104_0312 [Phycisphaerae bacterium]|jgi:uncharacterized RDD family membrane protein YckC|nr:MAG: hypothetical protein KatS3mg104_0312 [Phycisphaerae bacterium]
MNKLYLYVLLVGIFLGLNPHHVKSEPRVVLNDHLQAVGSRTDFWVARTMTVGQELMTNIYKRTDPVAGSWKQVARFQSSITSLALVGNRLAVLLPSGEWRMIDDSPGPLGAAFPYGYQPIALFSDPEGLLAVAKRSGPVPETSAISQTESDEIVILQHLQNVWSVLMPIPDEIAIEPISVLKTRHSIYLAGRQGEFVEVYVQSQNRWERLWRLDGTAIRRWKLLPGPDVPLLATMTDRGVWRVYFVGSDTPIREPSEPYLPSDITMVGPTLRIVYAEDQTIKQLAYDDYGRGATYPVTVIAHTPPAQETMQTWVQILGLILLTLTMLLTFRQKPATPDELLHRGAFQVSPYPRRFAAGLIDAIPQLVGAVWTLDLVQQSPASSTTLYANAPYLAGTFVYLLHVTISEVIWGCSVGKFLFGLRVVSYDGSRAPTERILLRNLLRLVDMLFYAPLLLIFLTPMRQRVGDLAAKTIVIYETDPRSRSAD